MAKSKESQSLVFAPLGGVEEVGLNASLFGYGKGASREWILVDCGLGFTGDYFQGVDVCVPDLSFVESEGERVKALVITHGHEDHIGALGYLASKLQCPIYLTPFAKALFMAKWPSIKPMNFREVEFHQDQKIGAFTVRFLPVTHSIPESSALLIKTDLGTVVHTGDWKLDREQGAEVDEIETTYRAIGEESGGIDALICDSTNAPTAGFSPTEQAVEDSLIEIVGGAKGAIGVTLFASNVRRLCAIAEAAHRAGRSIVPLGRAVERTIMVARECGYFPEKYQVLGRDALNHVARSKLLVLLSGSQGESRAALARSAYGTHPTFKFESGDTAIFSSRAIPGNEVGIGRIINKLLESGVEVVTDKHKLVHVSGHPRQNELSKLYEWLKPKKLVPVHGEPYHLHAQKIWAEGSAPDILIPRNGAVIQIAPGKLQEIDEVPTGRILVDGKLLYHAREPFTSERYKLSQAGVAFFSVAIGPKAKLADEVYFELIGIPSDLNDGGSVDDVIYDHFVSAFNALSAKERQDPERVEKQITRAIQGKFREIWDKRPLVRVAVHYL